MLYGEGTFSDDENRAGDWEMGGITDGLSQSSVWFIRT